MADDKPNAGQPVPPKIKLTKNGSAKPDTSRIDLAATSPVDVKASAGEPLNIRDVLQPSAGKAETSRISLHDSQPIQPGEQVTKAKLGTSRVVLAEGAGEAKTGTSRVKLEDSQGLPKTGTARITLDDSQTVTGGKGVTARITLDESQPVALKPEEKSATVRVDLTDVSGIEGARAAAAADEAARNRTARIVIEPEAAAPIAPPPAPAAKGAPPKTIKLQRPAAAVPKTVVLQRPAEAPAAATPRTVVLRKPGEAEESKGATAKISIPELPREEAAGSQRKTIRIKRPDGTTVSGGKKISLAKPAAPSEETGGRIEIETSLGIRDDSPGGFYTILAIAATIVVGVLLYLLLAQTLAPTLPWPGKIPVA